MMKVLIVDDERFIAQSIAQLVSEHPSCTVAGLAANGAEALELLEAQPADLVITDIRMPVMDGMELLKRLQQKYPQCLAIVLSGYSEFEYVKAALQYHACDYLLKPIVRGKLFPLLDKVHRLWTDRRHAQTHALIQQALDGKILFGEPAAEFYLLLTQNGQGQPEPVFGSGSYAFHNAFEQLLVVEDDPQVPELAARYLEQFKGTEAVNLICTERPVPLKLLQATAAQLRTILQQKVRMYRSELFIVDPTAPQFPQSIPLRELHPNRAVDAICTKKRSELLNCLTEVLVVPDIRQIDVQNYLETVISDTRLAYHMTPDRLSQIKITLKNIISHAAEPSSCAQQLVTHLMTLQDESAAKRDAAVIVHEIARQLDAEFYLPFTTESLATKYGITPRYLNRVFKEYKGQRPMEYLVTLRMKRAKFLLETTPDAMIKDVANSVGYTDALYFSKTFKRETGLWPKEVQQNIKK